MYIFMLRMMITECNICSWLQRWIRQKNALIPCTTEYRLKVEMQWNDIYDNVCCIHCIYAFWLVAHIICFFSNLLSLYIYSCEYKNAFFCVCECKNALKMKTWCQNKNLKCNDNEKFHFLFFFFFHLNLGQFLNIFKDLRVKCIVRDWNDL